MNDLLDRPASESAPESAPTAAKTPARLPVRRLRVDLSKGFGKLWNGGDAFRTHYLNALSMSFPIGEQFFIDSLKRGVAAMPPEAAKPLAEELRGFVGQEATHRFLHGQFNKELERQGLRNHWQNWAAWRVENGKRLKPETHVAVTAAYEHFTAVMSTGLLRHPKWLAGAEPELALLWRWHAVEESEHKAVAIDVYRAMGASEFLRKAWFVYIALLFFAESSLQTFLNLWHSGHWWKPSVWWRGAKFLLGPGGVWWASAAPLARYLKTDFHPDHLEDADEMAHWLASQRDAYAIVG